MTTDTKLPHCPRCGSAPTVTIGDGVLTMGTVRCEACGFGLTMNAQWWASVVRAELARQVLEIRAHGHASETEDFYPVGLVLILPRVMKDYDLLGRHPIRLPGEDA